jgi:predicted nucleic acid-binding protein
VARTFIDAVFYVALLHPRDQHRARAAALASHYAREELVTSEPVFVEVLAFMAGSGSDGRARAVQLIDDARAAPNVTVVPQTHSLFVAGLELYRRRPDKGYSLTDAMSMAICKERGIEQVLTHDRHFAQEGFEILL